MNKISFLLLALTLAACQPEAPRSDAYGNFEATTILISAEANGQLTSFLVEEGQQIKEGQFIGLVDTTLLHLQREQVRAQIGTLPAKLQNSLAEIEVLDRQQDNLERERDRVARLVEKKAATPKQLDDLNGELTVIQQRIQAVRSNTNTANGAILAEKQPMLAQIALLDEQIRRAYLYSPASGTVLTKMAEPGEMVGIGSPLFRLGQLDTMRLRAYTSSHQLQNVSLGQKVEVLIDEGHEAYRQLSGTISWIADQAEFTPKTIQTKEDRVNLVYAFEVLVPNSEGKLKIGMPAEVNFTSSSTQATNQ
ncbi:HlyD family secretion protein [Lewinella sp. LCG006]|uniref:HlyD family secretion protein n=1 Tax=Lewinella sp. LCG006 TaxID=3231911 RepID=UPI00345F2FE1